MCFTASRLKNNVALCALQHVKHLQQRAKYSLLDTLCSQDPTNQILLPYFYSDASEVEDMLLVAKSCL